MPSIIFIPPLPGRNYFEHLAFMIHPILRRLPAILDLVFTDSVITDFAGQLMSLNSFHLLLLLQAD